MVAVKKRDKDKLQVLKQDFTKFFNGKEFYIERMPYAQKAALAQRVRAHGGKLNFSVTPTTQYVVTSCASACVPAQAQLSKYKLALLLRAHAVVVDAGYIDACADAQALVEVSPFLVSGKQVTKDPQPELKGDPFVVEEEDERVWRGDERDQPSFPNDYVVGKQDYFKRGDEFHSLELHMAHEFTRFRVSLHFGNLQEKGSASEHIYCRDLSSAMRTYSEKYYKINTLENIQKIPLEGTGGSKDNTTLPEHVEQLINRLFNATQAPITSRLALGSKIQITYDSIYRAIACLCGIRALLQENHPDKHKQKIEELSRDFYACVPHSRSPTHSPGNTIDSWNKLDEEVELCQLILDLLEVNEVVGPSSTATQLYKSLRCNITIISPNTDKHTFIHEHFKKSNTSSTKIEIVNIFALDCAHNMVHGATHTLPNTKMLFHGSKTPFWVGILRRGLIIPSTGRVERTDKGMLGDAIYFAQDPSISLKYTGHADSGTKFIAVAQVQLGSTKSVFKVQPDLLQAPNGYNSLHGVKHTTSHPSEFLDDEYAVYDPTQVKLLYLLEVAIKDDYSPKIEPKSTFVGLNQAVQPASIKEPEEKVEKPTGLLGANGEPLPLISVNVLAKVVDMVSKVVLILHYHSPFSENINAKYVFPHDEKAVVSGLEVFVGGKHIVAKVKEKEKAHKEYRQAVEQGHGAYLMDQDSDDRLSISIGNLPPKQDVFLKVTYISELVIQNSDILFVVPPTIMNCGKNAQGTSTISLAITASISLANDIEKVVCKSHQIEIKKTASKATVKMLTSLEGNKFEPFELLISQGNMQPRMWLEKDSTGHYAAMLNFFPDFSWHDKEEKTPEIVIIADCSASMMGDAFELLRDTLAQILASIEESCSFNIVAYSRLFVDSLPNTTENKQAAYDFIDSKANFSPNMGGTEVWSALLSLSLMAKAKSAAYSGEHTTSVIMLTDGKINDNEWAVRLLVESTKYIRVFPVGIGADTNSHCIRSIAKAGGGIAEFTRQGKDVRTVANLQVERSYRAAQSLGYTNVQVTWEADRTPAQVAPFFLPPLLHKERYIVYALFDEPSLSAKLAAYNTKGQGEVSWKLATHDMAILSGDFIHKLAARALIRDWEEGVYDIDGVRHARLQSANKVKLIELSTRYNVLTQWTSFVAVEERTSNQEISPAFQIEKLLDIESIDELAGLTFEQCLQFNEIQVEQSESASKSKSNPMRPIKIRLMDDTVKTILVNENANAEEVVQTIADKMGIKNSEEFSLRQGGNWLDSSQSLKQQTGGGEEVFNLAKKFFVSDANISRDDPVLLHLLYIQCRDDIASGKLIIYDETLMFAALQCQIEYGNYNPQVHKPDFLNVAKMMTASKLQSKTKQDVIKDYRKYVGMSEHNAKYRYLQLARSLATYGMTTFKVKGQSKSNKKDCLLGITRDSIFHLNAETMEVVEVRPLNTIRRWAAAKSTFTLDFGDHADEYQTYTTNEGEAISQLISGCIDILLKKRKDSSTVLSDLDGVAVIETPERVIGVAKVRVAEAIGRRPEEEDVRDDLGNQKRDVSELNIFLERSKDEIDALSTKVDGLKDFIDLEEENTGLVDQKQNAVMHTEDVGRQLEAEKIRARQAMPTSESSTAGMKLLRRFNTTKPKEAVTQMRKTMEHLDRREQFIESKCEQLTKHAQSSLQKGSKRASTTSKSNRFRTNSYLDALMCLKKKKMFEAQLEKIQTARTTFETQLMTVESADISLEALESQKSMPRWREKGRAMQEGEERRTREDNTEKQFDECLDVMHDISDAISMPIGSADGQIIDEDALEAELEALMQEHICDSISITPARAVSKKSQPDYDEEAVLRELEMSMTMGSSVMYDKVSSRSLLDNEDLELRELELAMSIVTPALLNYLIEYGKVYGTTEKQVEVRNDFSTLFVPSAEDPTSIYVITEKIRESATESVVRAIDKRSGQEVDIHRIRGSKKDIPPTYLLQSFCWHKNIVQISSIHHSDHEFWIAEEVPLKFTIDKFVKKFNRNKRMPEEYVAYIISCVLEGLNYLHSKHIIHGNVSASNLKVFSNGIVKIGDFSNSKLVYNSTSSEKDDIIEVGVLIYQLCTGVVQSRVPFQQRQQEYSSTLGNLYSTDLADLFVLCVSSQSTRSATHLLMHSFLRKACHPFDFLKEI